MAQMVNPQVMILPASTASPNSKDSRWLTLEVCREFQRSKCSRTETECKFAHPPPHVEVQNGRVVACFDSIKGKCQRKDPPCKYLHAPQHLREQLLQNGRNNLILKNMQLQAYQHQLATGVMPVAAHHPSVSQAPTSTVIRHPALQHSQSQAQAQVMAHAAAAAAAAAAQSPYDASPYTGIPTLSALPTANPASPYSPYIQSSLPAHTVAMTTTNGEANQAILSQAFHPSILPASAAKAVRADKFEVSSENGETLAPSQHMMEALAYHPAYLTQVCREFQRGTCSRSTAECRYAHPAEHILVDSSDNHVTVCMDFVKSKCSRDFCKYFHPPAHLQALVRAAHARNQANSAAAAATTSASPPSSNAALPPTATAATAATLPPHHAMVYTKKRPRDPTDELLLSSMPGAVPYKRIAMGDISKGGIPLYPSNPLMSTFQQPASLMQLQQHPSYIPVSYTPYVLPSDSITTPVMPQLTTLNHAGGLFPMVTAIPSAQLLASPTLTGSPTPVVQTSLASPTPSSPPLTFQTAGISHSPNSSISGSNLPSNLNINDNSNMVGSISSNGLNLYQAPSAVGSKPCAIHHHPLPNNACFVEYFGSNKQLRDTLPVCQDFRIGRCVGATCKKVHLSEDYVEVTNGHVTVCRDFATRQTCKRSRCKYYHIPIDLPPS